MLNKKLFTQDRRYRDFLAHTHISIKNKYVYFAVAKAANSTIKYYLQKIEYLGTPYPVVNVHNKHVSPLLSPYQLSDEMLEEVFFGESYTRFTMVRNPYTRLLSCFLDRLQDVKSGSYRVLSKQTSRDPRELSFQDFVEVIAQQKPAEMDSHWRPQTYETYHGLVMPTSVLRFEELPANLAQLKNLTSCKDESIFEASVNKSPSATSASDKLRQHYTGDCVNLVAELYASDFEAFGYSTELPV